MSSVVPCASLRSIFPILFLLAVIGFLPVNARSATYTVTTAAPVGPGSLRAAIALANGTPSDDVIVFSEAFSPQGTIFLSRTLPPIAGTLTIDGGNHKVTITGDNQHRILDINPGAVLTILNLTLINGITHDTGGGAAIRNNGTLTINNSTLSGNSTGASHDGGAIANFGTATIVSSTISGNQASGSGGGIANSGTLNITSSTVTNNTANSAGGGIYNCMGCTLNAKNTIIAGNTNASLPDVSGTLTSQGYNLVGNTSGMSITGDTTGNILGQGAELAPLADNGGLTMTHRLLLTSPAIDTGNGAGLATDQRGLARRYDAPGFSNAVGGDTSDIGAFEVQPRLVVTAPASTTPGTPINITVTATGLDGSVGTAYSGTVHFTSTDPNATLPADYTFVASDNGTHQFSVTLSTPGDHTITAADLTAAVTGTSRNTRVIGPLHHFTIDAPTAVMSGVPLFFTVTARDSAGNPATGYTGTIRFTSSDPAAILPGDTTINSSHNATRRLTATLNTLGGQTITVADTADPTLTGTSNTIIVQAGTSNIVVTRTDDRDQSCTVGDCSIREAINAASAFPTDDTISFDPVVFANPQSIELNPFPGGMHIQNNGKLTINGARKVTLTGETLADRALHVHAGADVTINELTIDGIKGGQNGGISITAGGKVTLNNSTISNNWSNVSGIGILNSGTLIMNNSTISGNHGTDNNGNHIDGAGIYNGGTATIRNSTIAFNNSFICGICGHGGGIYNNPITGGTVTLANTIVVENDDSFPSDLYGTFISEGYNMYFDVFEATITGDTTTDVRPVFPRLAPLANNGGGVKTHALLFDSPAIDHGKSFGVSVDQRGLPRGVDQPTVANGTGSDISDIGAFELQLNTVLVNTTADGDDGACTAVGTGNGCTLREAINAANSTPLGSTISLDPTAFPKTAARADSTSAVTLQLTSALPALSSFTTISGPGARELSVRGEGLADPYSIFTIASGATVTISGLTITNGVSTSNVNGGGITNAGTLTLQNAAVSGNPASITVANASGGIVNSGTMTIVSSTISGNLAGSVGFGGGIYNNSPGVLTLQNSTVSGNTARGGGGIHNISTMTLQNSTVSSNTATIRGGGIDGMATVTLKGSIVAGNTALSLIPDIDGTVQSDGYNLIGNSGGTTINQNPGAGPNITDVDPQLGPLANNGGQTDTHAPSPTSPAIDQGKAFGSTTDQRGLTRPIDFTWIANAVGGDGADIGAFERQFATAATVTISGRILTADGRGVRNARITLTDSQGISRSVLTYSYGYYVVSDIRPGESVVINITSRRYRFTPQLLTISDSISGLDFVLDEP